MKPAILSLRTFIGSKDFEISRSFYRELGFEEIILSQDMCLFKSGKLGFYLQNYDAQQWLENTMLFIEVDDADLCYEWLQQLNLTNKYSGVRLQPVRREEWGKECFVIDPAGVLLHFGHFYQY